jgi:hypothetical protein
MLIYTCNICKYNTTNKSNFNRHNKTQNHIDRKKEFGNLDILLNNPDNKIKKKTENHLCDHCFAKFKSKWNLKKHIDRCKIKKKIDDEINKNKNLEENIEEIKKQITDIKNTINPDNDEIKNINSLSYVNKYYSDADELEPINDSAFYKKIYLLDYSKRKNKNNLDNITKKEMYQDLSNIIINNFNNNKLDSYLGDIVFNFYERDDPNKQGLWSSDTSRFTFLIRKKNDNCENIWQRDPKGVEVKEIAIKPLLKIVIDIMNKTIKDNSCNTSNFSNFSNFFINNTNKDKLNKLIVSTEIKSYAENKLEIDILKYIAPKFLLKK